MVQYVSVLSETYNREVGNTVMNKTFQHEAGVDNLVLSKVSIRDTSSGMGSRLETLFDK